MMFMRIKKIIFINVFSFLSIVMYAQQTTRSEAINASINIMRYNGIYLSQEDVDSVYRFEKNGNVLLYEVLFRSGEVVLLSGCKACMPIIGYSLTIENESTTSVLSNYDELPWGLKDMLNEYMEQIELGFEMSSHLQVHEEWAQLMNYYSERQNNSIVVGPLLSSRWGQGKSNCGLDDNAYNYYVTQICSNNNQNCYAGCDAVSLAQIMYFWKYPVFFANKNRTIRLVQHV